MSTTYRDTNDSDEDCSYAVAVTLTDGGWQVTELSDAALDSLDETVAQLRRMRAEQACFALLNVDDDYFVIVRTAPDSVRLVLSDATAAASDDLAADVMDELDEDIIDADDDEIEQMDAWPEGDMEILADLGLAEDMLAVICEDQELWASEQLHAVAQVLGFEDELAETTGFEPEDSD
ncbi:tRNA adenosine deaminase-associated protein [Corynebacterium sp. TAE3-ERU12]|uniref:tRNA adenosine deaminase-associated protein n=1 Tax=Corynebacterium sp. TAE3-ERU12 TaxID=2849491 RepID=UPI001C44DB8E|nr:tRNA adenosine deaminase-associated protein [Corynebacterium sp. TAE3-ERU12]MBV7294425.1 tRNA adenosine deaminase-associated protein [Corynebacterium sp. TAE3-ERU12]